MLTTHKSTLFVTMQKELKLKTSKINFIMNYDIRMTQIGNSSSGHEYSVASQILLQVSSDCIIKSQNFWATVYKTVRLMLLDRCLSVLPVPSVCDVGVLWPNGWMDQDETWQVGLGPGHIVLDGDPDPLSQRGTAPPPVFWPYLLWPNGSMDQDATWYVGRPRPRRHCVRWGPSSLQKDTSAPYFSPVSVAVKRLDRSRCHLVCR